MVNMCLRIYTEKVPSVKCNISWNWTCGHVDCVVHHPKFCKIKDLQFCSYNKRGLINGPYSVVTIRNILIHTCIIFYHFVDHSDELWRSHNRNRRRTCREFNRERGSKRGRECWRPRSSKGHSQPPSNGPKAQILLNCLHIISV